MSSWTYIQGTITVSPIGRTQAEKRYILDTVLAHLPIVSGQRKTWSICNSKEWNIIVPVLVDEFGERTNNLVDRYGNRTRK